MSDKIRSSVGVLGFKKEVVAGVAEALTGDEVKVLVTNPQYKFIQNLNERNPISSSFSRYASIPGSRHATLSFSVEFKGSGTAGVAPALGAILEVCGLKETIVADTSVGYAFASVDADIPSGTFGTYIDGLKEVLYGARGTAKWAAKSGELTIVDVTLTGLYVNAVDAAMLVPTTYEATKPAALLGATFSLYGTSLPILGYSLDLGVQVSLVGDGRKADGYDCAIITGRKPTAQFSINKQKIATFNANLKLKQGDLGALVLAIGATAGNITTINAPALQITGLDSGNENGVVTQSIDTQLTRSDLETGEDELTIVLT